MSCTLMYQPYAMSYSSSGCDRNSSSSLERQKQFKFPHVPSPPDSSSNSTAGGGSPFSLPLIPPQLSYPHHQHHTHHPHQHLESSRSSSSSSRRSLTPCATITSERQQNEELPHASHHTHTPQQRAQYLSANCVVYENYSEGDSAREVDDHFSRALSCGATAAEKTPQKNVVPMSTRNFPPSFWDSAYQPPPPPPPPQRTYSDFYGDYTSQLHHHHQSDPWHYPLTSHHHHHPTYSHHHHRADLAAAAAYTPIPSTSRFNPAQYSSFLFPSATPGSAASSRFSSKADPTGGHWTAGGRYHPHESSWSDFHLADYSAAAAHYSNMTAAGNF